MGAKLKEMLVSVDEFETRVAVLEDRELMEIYFERGKTMSVVGSIYLGRVKDILPGMDAAFIDIGLEKNAFLYVDEIVLPEEIIPAPSRKIQYLLKRGQDILVQVAREPMGGKGASVTTDIAFPGRYLVLMPFGDGVGTSHRLSLEERERLRLLGESIVPEEMGLIVRTAAKDAELLDLKKDLKRLLRLWKEINRQAQAKKAPAQIFSENELTVRVIRDVFSPDFQYILVDCPSTYKKILAYLDRAAPELKNRVTHYRESIPLFEKFDLENELKNLLESKVWLRSGGFLVINQTEALTTIDVNTGKYIGESDLERTIFKTNLEAAKEIARQLRLRDIGGIIVVDFIDMKSEHHRDEVFEVFNEALAGDRMKSRVIEISRLGLVEMTRKNISKEFVDFMCETCACCGGTGRVLSLETIAIEVARKIRRICKASSKEAFMFRVSSEVFDFFNDKGREAFQKLEREINKRIFLFTDLSLKNNQLELVREGTRKEVGEAYRGFVSAG